MCVKLASVKFAIDSFVYCCCCFFFIFGSISTIVKISKNAVCMSTLFKQGSLVSHWLVSKGALRNLRVQNKIQILRGTLNFKLCSMIVSKREVTSS